MEVKIYSTTHCPWCAKAKDFLESKGVKFESINVEEDQERAQEMIAKSGQTGVPVIEIGDKIIVGFDRAAIEKALSGSAESDMHEHDKGHSCEHC